MTDETRVSAYALRASTQEGRLSLAAAKLALRVTDMLQAAKNQSGLNGRQLAARMDVSEGWISQILNSDGNLRVATIARFLAACGYELTLKTEHADGRNIQTGIRRQPKRQADRPRSSWHLFEQSYVSTTGITRHVHVIDSPADALFPLGEPVSMGTISRHTIKTMPAGEAAAWQQKTKNALEHEGIVRRVLA